MAVTARTSLRVRTGTGVMLAWVAIAVAAVAVRANPPPPDEAPPSLAERAKAVLADHCPDCRDRYGEGAALDLRALADDPGLITPRYPDASPAYQRFLAPSQDAEGEKEGEAPSSAEIETVRDWIEALPARSEACQRRTPVAPDDVTALMGRWNTLVGGNGAAATAFVSLAHLWNACVPVERMMELRVAAATLLGVLMRRREGLHVETLGEASALLAVSPGEQALEDSGWDRLTADAPRLVNGTVPADWLAARVLARRNAPEGDANPTAHVRFDGAVERAVEALARFWTRDVDLVRAAAERGVSPRDLKRTLAETDDHLRVPAQRLIYGALPREAWQRLSSALDGAPADNIQARATQDTGTHASLDVMLWPDKTFYRPRDLVTFNVRVEKACHLTLIDVDAQGQAIVLFPNDIEQDNLIAPGLTVKVPGHGAEYQFRFDKAGVETVVAVCQRHARRLAGLAFDYERQRFTILGDWRTFLRTAPEREKKIREKRAVEEARRKRRRRKPLPPEPPPVAPNGPPLEGRAAIAVTVDLGGRAPSEISD